MAAFITTMDSLADVYLKAQEKPLCTNISSQDSIISRRKRGSDDLTSIVEGKIEN